MKFSRVIFALFGKKVVFGKKVGFFSEKWKVGAVFVGNQIFCKNVVFGNKFSWKYEKYFFIFEEKYFVKKII